MVGSREIMGSVLGRVGIVGARPSRIFTASFTARRSAFRPACRCRRAGSHPTVRFNDNPKEITMNKFTTLATGITLAIASIGAFAQAQAVDAARRPARSEPAGAHRRRRRLRPAHRARDQSARQAAGARRRGRGAGQGRRHRHAARAPPAASHAGPREQEHPRPEARRAGRADSREAAAISRRRRPRAGRAALERERARVERIARRARDLGGERHRLLQRQRGEQRHEHCIVTRLGAGRAVAASACRTSTNSPRERFGSAASHAGRSRAGIVAIVSNCLVSSRQTVIAALGARRGERVGERFDPVRRLEHDLRRPRARQRARGACARSLPRAGKKADEREAGRADVAGRRQRGERAARARNRHDAMAGGRAPPRPARRPGRSRAGVPASLT